jgi:hypothetical protein
MLKGLNQTDDWLDDSLDDWLDDLLDDFGFTSGDSSFETPVSFTRRNGTKAVMGPVWYRITREVSESTAARPSTHAF